MRLNSRWLAPLALLTAALWLPAVVTAARVTPGPLYEVSGDSPFTDCTADRILNQPGTLYPGSEVESLVVVNPTDPGHVYAAWGRLNFRFGRRPAFFTRTTDGGETWEPALAC